MNEKLKYSSAELEIIGFAQSDVIATSGDGPYTDTTYEPDGWV